MPSPSWLVLLYTLPASHAAARLNLWRRLRRLGAVALKTSAYVLPEGPENLESLQWLAQEIRQDGGESTLLRSAEVDMLMGRDVINLFQSARAEDYAEILNAVAKLTPAGRGRRAKPSPSVKAELPRLNRRFVALQKIDFFNCPAAGAVRDALDKLAPARNAAPKGRTVAKARYQGRCWQTRPRPELDRIASAWLIRRFIDPKSTFLFSSTPGRRRDVVTFDSVDADFGHEGDDCTFEILARRFRLTSPGLAELGEIVHAADLDDGKFARVEGVGLVAALRGWALLGVSDDVILRRGLELMDGLYRQFVRS